MLVGVRVRMEDQKRENRIGSASKVIIAVAVVASVGVTDVALILSLVDPLHDVLMVRHRRSLSALASPPTARRVLSP